MLQADPRGILSNESKNMLAKKVLSNLTVEESITVPHSHIEIHLISHLIKQW